MSILNRKNILLGISGGIAAYKSAFLVRLLVKNGANVQVIMTPNAKDFVTPLTLSTLSKRTVLSDFFLVLEIIIWLSLLMHPFHSSEIYNDVLFSYIIEGPFM